MVSADLPCALHDGFSDVREALKKCEEVAVTTMGSIQASRNTESRDVAQKLEEQLRDAQTKNEEIQQTNVMMQMKVAKLEEKLETKRVEIKKLTAGIQDLVDKYEAKLDSKRKENAEMQQAITKLSSKLEGVRGVAKGENGKKVEAGDAESSSPEPAKKAQKRSNAEVRA